MLPMPSATAIGQNKPPLHARERLFRCLLPPLVSAWQNAAGHTSLPRRAEARGLPPSPGEDRDSFDRTREAMCDCTGK
jgi:hypothetical protein